MKRCACCGETEESLGGVDGHEGGPTFLDPIEVTVERLLCVVHVCVWCARPFLIALGEAIADTTEAANG